jgi:hypothetical protein
MFQTLRLAPRTRSRHLRLETFEERVVPALELGTNITSSGSASIPPIGNSGAVGPDHYVQFQIGQFIVFDKSGAAMESTSDTQFWQDLGVPLGTLAAGLSEPRVVYDPLSARWFATEINLATTNNEVLLARSDTADPTGSWQMVRYPATSNFGTFPTLGVDGEAVYIGTANFLSQTVAFPSGVTMTKIPKASLLQATPTLTGATTFNQAANAANMGWAPQVVNNFNAADPTAAIIATHQTQFGKINFTRITGTTLGSTANLNIVNNPLPGDSRQPDGTRIISSGEDDRYTGSAVQVGNLIYAVHTISVDATGVGVGTASGPATTNAVHLIVINDTTGAVVAQKVYFNPSYDYIFPSVAANQYGDIVIGMNRSGGSGSENGNLGAFAVYGRIDPANPTTITWGQEIQLKAGNVSDYNQTGSDPEVWGPYSATQIDPSNPLAFWTTQEFAQASTTWATQISQIHVSARVTDVSSPLPPGTYGVGQLIPINITFNAAVTVTGTPQLALNSGGTAVYAGGSGTNELTFLYTVGTGQSSADLDYSSASALTLNGGTIQNTIGDVAADLGLAAPGAAGSIGASADIVIDSVQPAVTGVSSPTPNGTYGFADTVLIRVTFNRPVDVTGTPELALNSGGTAYYTGGGGTNVLTFTYDVLAGHFAADLDATSTTALSLAGGQIDDASNGSDAVLTLPTPGGAGSLGVGSNIAIDALPPRVTDVTSPIGSATLRFGESVDIVLTFNNPVNVAGVPRVALNSGGTATYASGSGTASLTFTYTVGTGDFTADLDYASTTALTLDGGTITEVSSGQAANLTLPIPGGTGSLAANEAIAVDALQAVVTTVSSPTANGVFAIGGVIAITVKFNRPVVVTGGIPTLALNSGGTATYTSGSGTDTLTFTYTVGSGENTTDLDAASANALSLNGATIEEANGLDALVTVPVAPAVGSLAANKNLVVDAVGPTLVEFRVLFGSKRYDLLTSTRTVLPWQITGIQVVFNEPITSGRATSLTGITASRLIGLKTKTLTWKFSGKTVGEFSTALAHTGTNALKDKAGNPIAAFTQDFDVLYGDFNQDRVVNAADEAGIRANLTGPYQPNDPAYNIFADVSGDGLVNLVDVNVARARKGKALPS